MTAVNVPADSTWPQIPDPYKPVVRDGNLTAFKPAGMPVIDGRTIDALQMMHLQRMLELREYISVGSYGMDPAWQYNAKGSYNIKDRVSATIVSVSGNQITLDFGVDPRGLTLFQARKLSDDPLEIGLRFWIPGYGGFGPPQPNMALTYGPESVMYRKSMPLIRKIISCSGSVWTFELNQTCNNAMTPSDPDSPPLSYSVNIWNQYGNPPDWLKIQEPTWFRGVRKKRTVRADALPEDGILALESTAVAHTPGFNNQAVFTIEGRTDESPTWVNLGDAGNRLFVRTFNTTPATYDAVVALKDTKPAYAAENAPEISDITGTYDVFRITYWKKKATGCEAPCYGRCIHHRIDYNGSSAVIPSDVGGQGVDANGKKSYCALATYHKEVLSDEVDRVSNYPDPIPGQDGIMDTVTLVKSHPSGIANFPADGSGCLQFHTCDKFEAAENNTGNDAFWRYATHASRFFVKLVGACSMRRIQKMPGYSQSWNFEEQNIEHPGLQWQAGFAFINSTVASLHPNIVKETPGLGRWTTSVEVVTDEDGNSTIVPKLWHNYHGVTDPDTQEITVSDGAFPAVVTDFKPSRLPLGGTEDLNEIERLGVRTMRDTGASASRGLDNWSCALPAIPLYARGFSMTAEGVQENDTFRFERVTA